MDEDETTETVTIPAIRHDRWSVLILGLSWAMRVTQATTTALSQGCDMACQHANYKTDQDKFLELAKRWKDDG